jgi:glycosyltransferase involved in cell wall biosynthesis
MPAPLVSVLINTYNHESFIEEAILSVLAQDFPAAGREIIVVDDGSNDRTPEILKKFEGVIRVLTKPNGGQASTFNIGIPACHGEFIAFLDGDDWWAPQKLSKVVAAFGEDPSLGAIGHGIIVCSGKEPDRFLVPECRVKFRLDSYSSADFFRLNKCYFGTSRLTLRASIARAILPVPESLVFEADEYVFTLAPALSHALLLPEPLTFYRVHGQNLFMTPQTASGGLRRKQKVFASLSAELRRALPSYGASPAVSGAILEMLDAEASQLRLQVDGGWSWETYSVETTLFRLQHREVPKRTRAFRALSMLPALLLPPRWYYLGRGWLGSKEWYVTLRRLLLPSPAFVPNSKEASRRTS